MKTMEKIRDETNISQLPDGVLHYILSFLPFELVLQTCYFLSKRWKSVCDQLPYINLTEISSGIDNSPKIEVLNFVDKYLLMRQKNKSCIQRFQIKVACCNSQFASYMSMWVERLSQNCNIREMCFSNAMVNLSNIFSFPQAILSAESLTELKLTGCLLVLDIGVDIKLVSLKVLWLNHVFISQELVERLVKSCVKLEHISLNHCDGFSSLKVEGLLGLDKLVINRNRSLKRVEIDEPSLIQFYYNGIYVKHDDITFSSCINLRRLYLSHANITREQLSKQLAALEKLRELNIVYCPEITSFNISYRWLKKLNVRHHGELAEANIIAPKLESFTLVQRVSISTKKLSLSLDAPPTLKLKYRFYFQILGPTTFIELLKFLRMFDRSQLSFTTNIQNSNIPREWIKHFSRMKSLSQFKKFWARPDTKFLDVLRSTCTRVIHEEGYNRVKIHKAEPIEVDEELQP